LTHRPGKDPDAVIKASKSADSSAKANLATDASLSERSERYSKLAQLKTGRMVQAAVNSQTAKPRSLQTAVTPASTMTEQEMLELWEQSLSMVGLGVEDDYFAIGGTSLQAARLFSEIACHFAIKLPLTTILTSPTIRLLARQIEFQSAIRERSVVQLKSNSNAKRNIFFIHDGDGETLLYANLARRLPDDFAVFGVEPRTALGVPLAHTRIEDMAAHYIERMRQVQPQGPLIVGGMCAGGVIAYEIASQLVRRGDKVEYVFLLDAATPQAARPHGQVTKNRLGRFAKLFMEDDGYSRSSSSLLRAAAAKVWRTLRWEIGNSFEKWTVRLRFWLLETLLKQQMSWPRMISGLTVRQIYETAEAKYIPKPLPGTKIALVRATKGNAADTPYQEIYSDGTLGWETSCADVKILDVEGGHFSMLQEPFVQDLAEQLSPLVSTRLSIERIVPLQEPATA
jgi:thioesterase domain-containing protein